MHTIMTHWLRAEQLKKNRASPVCWSNGWGFREGFYGGVGAGLDGGDGGDNGAVVGNSESDILKQDCEIWFVYLPHHVDDAVRWVGFYRGCGCVREGVWEEARNEIQMGGNWGGCRNWECGFSHGSCTDSHLQRERGQFVCYEGGEREREREGVVVWCGGVCVAGFQAFDWCSM